MFNLIRLTSLLLLFAFYCNGQTTYYSRNGATPPRNWNEADSWTLNSDGSGAAAAIPGRADHVVILIGHDIRINAVNDNGVAGVSPNSLSRTNVGPFAGSADNMFYQTGNIIIRTGGFLTVTLEEIMIEGYTLVEGTFTISEDIVNLGYLEISAGATFTNTDDLILSGNSVTIMNNTSLANDDIYIDHTDALLCGTGVMQIGNGGPDPIINWNNPGTARLNQICAGFMITCMTNCTAGSTGTGTGSFISGNSGPGGVGNQTNNRLWLRANDLALANGAPVTSWADVSGNALTAVSSGMAAEEPTFNTNTVNGTLPSISFDGGDFLNLGSPAGLNVIPGTDSWSFLIVYNVTQNAMAPFAQGTFFSKASNANRPYQYTIDDSGVTSRFTAFIGGNSTIGTVVATDAWFVSSHTNTTTQKDSWTNEAVNFAAAGVGAAVEPTVDVLIGARRNTAPSTGTGFRLTGSIAEIMFYNRLLNLAQRIISTNYLAAKYAIALTANDVYTMDNVGNGNYDFEVAGIGQASDGTNHKDGRGSGIVRIWNPSGLANSEFLMWGHDNTALSSSNIVDVDGTIIEERLSRIWRVSETADVGTITISFDISGLSGSAVGSSLRLLIDRDGDGFADNDVAPVAGSFGNGTIVFSGVNFQDGDRFTLGNTDLSFPLPIELISFEALVQNKKVLLNWTTASETNNDFFSIERSREGGEWNVIENIKGAGTSNQTIHYRANDDSPLPKKSYYRLKQTDFDGRHQYSRVVQVEISSSLELIVSPNPTTGSIKVDTGTEKQPDRIVLFDPRGVQVVPIIEESTQGIYLNLESLPSGIYLLQVTIGLEVKSTRIVKQ